jgi:membrane protease YdiL (CAAX protease family)
MHSGDSRRVATALTVAVAIFLIAVVSPKLIFSDVIPSLMTTQGLELSLALLAIVTFGKSRFSEYGFSRPRVDKSSSNGRIRWIPVILTALLLGMAATPAVLVLGGTGNPLVKRLTLPQIVLFVWIFSSVIEEVFTRGFLQGHLSVLSGKYVRLWFFRIELPVLISAAFFACMHLVLLLTGADLTTIVVILLFTFSVGLLAGYLRAKTGSLIPAIAVHMMANIGGMIGGVVYAIVSFIITGHLPAM